MEIDEQQELMRRRGLERIEIPDDERRLQIVGGDDDDDDEFDAEALRALAMQLGPAALTVEEAAFLAAQDAAGGLGLADGSGHRDNLAEALPDNVLTRVSSDVIQWVDWDEAARADWYQTEQEGIRALGVTRTVDVGASFSGASAVVHPMIGEAVVQFGARALEQLWPAGGPVKSVVLGAPTDELTAQAARVAKYMNHQYTQEIAGAFDATDQMLLRLAMTGSVFVKLVAVPGEGVTRGMVEPADFLVPYRATSLATTPRYTERMLLTGNEVKACQLSGMYRNIKLLEPSDDGHNGDRDTVIDAIHDAEGRDESDRSSDDNRHTLLECSCELDLPGFEHRDDAGRKTGLKLPYLVTVDRDSQKVLSIYRQWKDGDPKRKRIVYHVHYKFTPGLGFYGYGLQHWIGKLGRAASGALNALLDAAHFSNLPAGYRSKDAKIPNGKMTVGPGEWPEVDATAEDLAKAFFPLPFKEPSAVLFNLMLALQDLGRRFAGTTEAMVGEGTENTPVGTMLARIEQAGQLQTAIQKRLHEAQGVEFKLLAQINGEWLPEQYPYAMDGEDAFVARADFDDRVDVAPVSDPNYVSNTQRFFVSQAVVEMAEANPDLYDRREVQKRVLESLRLQDIDKLLPDRSLSLKRMDPITENAQVMMGQPVKAFPDQAHNAHIPVHASVQFPPESPQAGAMQAHIQEHMALGYLLQMSQQLGMQFAMPGPDQPEIPPEVENQIAIAAAQALQQIAPPAAPPPDPEAVKADADIARKDATAAADIQRKDAVAMADLQRKDAQAQQQREADAAQFEQDKAAAAEAAGKPKANW